MPDFIQVLAGGLLNKLKGNKAENILFGNFQVQQSQVHLIVFFFIDKFLTCREKDIHYEIFAFQPYEILCKYYY